MAERQAGQQTEREALPFADCLTLLGQAREVLAGVRDVTWQAGGADLAEALGVLGEVALIADAAEVAVMAEVLQRGEHSSGECPLPPHEYVSAYSRRYPTGRSAANLVKLATGVKDTDRARPAPAATPAPDAAEDTAACEATNAADAAETGVVGAGSADGAGAEGGSAEGAGNDGGGMGAAFGIRTASGKRLPECLAHAVLSGAAPVGAAAAAVAEMTRLIPDLEPDAIEVVWQGYTDLAAAGDVAEVRKLRPALLAKYGRASDNERDETAARARAYLSAGHTSAGPLTEYRLGLDPEAAALLEAALDPLTKPVPGPDGAPDPRSVATRRAHALSELIARAVGADPKTPSRGSSHTTIIIPADDLADETGTATTMGGLDAGRFLTPLTARRLSCIGWLTPVILDGAGNPVLIGRTKRLFTTEQILALMVRDRGCTFPGCTRPAGWTDAHHLIHWIDGGATDLDNAALLCSYHHHIVHSRRLAGRVTTGPPGTDDEDRHRVTWDLTPGSYTHLLRERGPTTTVA
ncbi:MAG: DUF222 domain-containing protein [Tetrasphaera sp.]